MRFGHPPLVGNTKTLSLSEHGVKGAATNGLLDFLSLMSEFAASPHTSCFTVPPNHFVIDG